LIYAPAGLGYEILARMVGDNTHYFDYYSGIMLTSCAEKSQYETLYLWIDDYRFEISVDDYWIQYNDIVEVYDETATDTCLLAIIDDAQNGYWLVGDAFLKGYYTIHDNNVHTAAKIGFAPHATSSKGKVEQLAKPTTDVMDILWETTWIGLWVDASKFHFGIFQLCGEIWIWLFGLYPIF
jgi:hypothetical protein